MAKNANAKAKTATVVLNQPVATQPELTVASVGIVAIVEATHTEGVGFIWVPENEALELAELGYVEVADKSDGDPKGKLATRSTELGRSIAKGLIDAAGLLTAKTAASDGPPKSEVVNVSAAGTELEADEVEEFEFEVGNEGEIPSIDHNNKGRRKSKWSVRFDALQNKNDFFFVPGKEPEEMASTVAQANARYSEVVPDQFRTNRRGNQVPLTKPVRKFVTRRGEAKNKAGQTVTGTRIYRSL